MYKRKKANQYHIGDLENPIFEATLVKDFIDLKNKRVIEIGCGTAPHAKILAPDCLEYYAIDKNEKKILDAKKRSRYKNLHLEGMNGTKLKYGDCLFDVALMFHCLHETCLEEQGNVLKEIHRTLKNNGLLFVIETTSKPVSNFQKYFDIIHENIFNYKHIYGVKHSEWVINEYINRGWFSLLTEKKYKLAFEFYSIDELINSIKLSFKYETFWDQELNREFDRLIYTKINEGLNNKKIILEEIIKLQVLEK